MNKMDENSEEPIVFKVFYEGQTSCLSGQNGKNTKEVRKLVFSNLPNFKQLYERLVKIEQEKHNPTRENNVSPLHLTPKNIRIEYIDDEGDRITIACNDDLQYLVEEKVRYLLVNRAS